MLSCSLDDKRELIAVDSNGKIVAEKMNWYDEDPRAHWEIKLYAGKKHMSSKMNIGADFLNSLDSI